MAMVRHTRRRTSRRRRDSLGRFLNPFDRHGFFHTSARGRYARPLRSAAEAKKRSALARRLAKRRKRVGGRFANPSYANPFDRHGRFHSARTGRFAKHRRRRAKRSAARRNPRRRAHRRSHLRLMAGRRHARRNPRRRGVRRVRRRRSHARR